MKTSSFSIIVALLWQSSSAQDEEPQRYALRRRLNATDLVNTTDLAEEDTVNIETRIVGGTIADGDDFPWYVNLGGCGGTLIAPDVVLTAAHCQALRPYSILVGGSTLVGGAPRFIERGSATVHPRYSSFTNNNDFMLYKLTSPVTNPPAILNNDPNNPSPDDATQVLTVVGFGRTEEDSDQFSFNLREVDVNHVPHNVCRRAYFQVREDTMFCAGVADGGKDSCQGDSGGPIVDQNGVVVGVTSWGNGCGKAGFPGVYARVSTAYD